MFYSQEGMGYVAGEKKVYQKTFGLEVGSGHLSILVRSQNDIIH